MEQELNLWSQFWKSQTVTNGLSKLGPRIVCSFLTKSVFTQLIELM